MEPPSAGNNQSIQDYWVKYGVSNEAKLKKQTHLAINPDDKASDDV